MVTTRLKRTCRTAPAVGALLLTGLLLWWHLPAVPRAVRRNGPTPAENLVALAPDGRWAATVELPSVRSLTQHLPSPILRIWDIAGERPQPEHPLTGLPELAVFRRTCEIQVAASGQSLLLTNRGHCRLIRVADARQTDLPRSVKSRLSPEGRWLALVTEDGPPPQPRLLVIDTSTGQVANQVRADQDGFTGIRPGAQIWQDCLWFGPDGQAFGAVVENQADGARALVIWDRASGQRRIHYRLPETASAIALAADGPTLAVAEGDPPQLRIRVVNLASGQETVCQRQDDGQGRLTLLLAPGGAALTAVLEGGPPPAGVCTSPTFARVTTWALPTGAMVVDAPGHQPNAPGDFVAEGVNPDRPRPYLLRDTGGDRWELVELATGRVRAVLTGRGDPPTYTWSPDGRWLVVRQIRTPPPLLATVQTWLAARGLCSAPGTGEWYHAIDLDTGRDVPGLAGPCGDWRFSPNSRYLATRDAEGAILVWELPPPRPWGWIVLGSLAAVVGLQLAGAGFRAWRRVPRRVGG